ncbi:hypothetical protein K456DRAFT_51208 [Colletotrichum gloeosporioides 23]|nr:hypothetical protein K456DRAFT_51208 [Colletotrichum gloeosporioides 23]
MPPYLGQILPCRLSSFSFARKPSPPIGRTREHRVFLLRGHTCSKMYPNLVLSTARLRPGPSSPR